MTLDRREFIQVAAALGASLAWGGNARASRVKWQERRDLYPEGVASGDPDSEQRDPVDAQAVSVTGNATF